MVSLRKTPETMSKSVPSSSEYSIAFVFLYCILIVETVSLGRPYTSSICSIFPLCIGETYE